MEKRKFGNTDILVTPLGFGGAEIGFGGTPKEQVEVILNAALDAGLNVIDTAECYRDSEEKIGATVSNRRAEYFLFTKCGHSAGFDEPDWTPSMLEKQIDRSLRLLRTDHVDLVQLHTCGRDVLESGGVIEVLQKAKDAGKTRYIGYSGDSETAKFAIELGVFDALQTSCNLMDQECIDLTLPLAKERGMGVIAKRPIANVCWRHASAEAAGYAGPYWTRFQSLQYQFENMVETALRFTLSQDLHVAIVGTTNPARWADNAVLAERGPLGREVIEAIRGRWKEVSAPDWIGQQ